MVCNLRRRENWVCHGRSVDCLCIFEYVEYDLHLLKHRVISRFVRDHPLDRSAPDRLSDDDAIIFQFIQPLADCLSGRVYLSDDIA